MNLVEAQTAYRVIGQVCERDVLDLWEDLGDKIKESYTVEELVKITRGREGNKELSRFINYLELHKKATN